QPAATAPAPTATAANGGPAPRRKSSWVASTSLTSRVSRSPERNACSPAGASRSSRRYTRTRSPARTRNATSWEASRSAYRKIPRPTLNARTATTAREIAKIGGCWAAPARTKPATPRTATPPPGGAADAPTGRGARAGGATRPGGGRPPGRPPPPRPPPAPPPPRAPRPPPPPAPPRGAPPGGPPPAGGRGAPQGPPPPRQGPPGPRGGSP